MAGNVLYYGDNLAVLRKHIASESVDLCYIDPPFNSKRNYNQIYNNIGGEDRAQAQAFIDTWIWDEDANHALTEILANDSGRFTSQTVDLIKGLHSVLKPGSLLAYLVSMTLRITEIHRVLKPTGSFYLHCDPTASHYLKVVLDSIFCAAGGDFINEIVWRRTGSHNPTRSFGNIHDTIFFYVKSSKFTFNIIRRPYMRGHVEGRYTKMPDGRLKFTSGGNVLTGAGAVEAGEESGKAWRGFNPTAKRRHWAIPSFYEAMMPPSYRNLTPTEKLEALYKAGNVEIDGTSAWPIMVRYLEERDGMPIQDIWAAQPYTEGTVYGNNEMIDADVQWMGPTDPERLGYPTQKPDGLLARIIKASSNENGVVLDAYCGCGTTVVAAQKLNRRWIGIDITYQSIALVLRRLEEHFGKEIVAEIKLNGIPRDMESAQALALKKDDRVRKEFEKWAVLTYSNNRAIINDKKGGDKGIDGTSFFMTGSKDNAKIVYQVKSGNVGRGDISKLNNDRTREKAELAIFITLQPPTAGMKTEAQAAGTFEHKLMGRTYHRIQIVTVEEMLNHARLDVPMSEEVLKKAKAKGMDQLPMFDGI
jgi:DNA modification methylase